MVQAQGSSSSNKPKDLTPKEYKALRPMVANLLGQTFGASYDPGSPESWSPNFGGGFGTLTDAVNPSFSGSGAPGGPFAMTLQDYYAKTDTDAFVAQMTPEEKAAYDASLAGFAPGLAQYDKTIAGDYLTPESNPFLRNYIEMAQRQLVDLYKNQNLEQKALFGRAGHTIQESSPFSLASAELSTGLLDATGDVGTKMSYDNYVMERDRQIAAVDQRFNLAEKQLALTELPRLIKQHGLDIGQQQFQQQMENLMEALKVAAGLSQATVANQQKSAGGGAGIGPFTGGGEE